MISAMKNMHKNDLEDARMLTVITWERHKKALALELGKKIEYYIQATVPATQEDSYLTFLRLSYQIYEVRISSISQQWLTHTESIFKISTTIILRWEDYGWFIFMQETQFRSLGWKDPLEKEQLLTPVFLPGEFHGQKNLAGYSPWGHKESGMTEQLTLSSSSHTVLYFPNLNTWTCFFHSQKNRNLIFFNVLMTKGKWTILC